MTSSGVLRMSSICSEELPSNILCPSKMCMLRTSPGGVQLRCSQKIKTLAETFPFGLVRRYHLLPAVQLHHGVNLTNIASRLNLDLL